jgi:hypothetical protein
MHGAPGSPREPVRILFVGRGRPENERPEFGAVVGCVERDPEIYEANGCSVQTWKKPVRA